MLLTQLAGCCAVQPYADSLRFGAWCAPAGLPCHAAGANCAPSRSAHVFITAPHVNLQAEEEADAAAFGGNAPPSGALGNA